MPSAITEPASGRLGASFRDPSGFVFRREGRILRQVNRVYQPHYDRLMSSGLYQELVDARLLVPHSEVDDEPEVPTLAFKVIEPERLPFITYPYEWCFSQLKDAALLTLEIQRRALAHGMSLKDCSGYNVQFRDGKPVFIDTLSFEVLRERPWVAYRQFTQHFLGPLALMSRTHIGLGKLLRTNLDGVPLDVASAILPRRSYLSPSLLIHLHLHAKAVSGLSASTGDGKPAPAMKLNSLQALAESLESAVKAQTWEPKGTEWADYATNNSYTSAASEHKRGFVGRFLDETKPGSVWDVAANTGEYSRLAAERGIPTVAFDIDPAAVERNYRDSTARGETRMLPLLTDVLDPSPSLGWLGRERMSLFERGPADACLALALIHHMAISGNIPLDQAAEFFQKVGRRLVIEFVPKTDSQFRRMMQSRDDVFDDYSQASFVAAFERYFSIDRAEQVAESERVLYAMTARK
jgi:hypothetical protein